MVVVMMMMTLTMQVLKFLVDYHFSDTDIDYLRCV